MEVGRNSKIKRARPGELLRWVTPWEIAQGVRNQKIKGQKFKGKMGIYEKLDCQRAF